MRQERSESSREQRRAVYKSDQSKNYSLVRLVVGSSTVLIHFKMYNNSISFFTICCQHVDADICTGEVTTVVERRLVVAICCMQGAVLVSCLRV